MAINIEEQPVEEAEDIRRGLSDEIMTGPPCSPPHRRGGHRRGRRACRRRPRRRRRGSTRPPRSARQADSCSGGIEFRRKTRLLIGTQQDHVRHRIEDTNMTNETRRRSRPGAAGRRRRRGGRRRRRCRGRGRYRRPGRPGPHRGAVRRHGRRQERLLRADRRRVQAGARHRRRPGRGTPMPGQGQHPEIAAKTRTGFVWGPSQARPSASSSRRRSSPAPSTPGSRVPPSARRAT